MPIEISFSAEPTEPVLSQHSSVFGWKRPRVGALPALGFHFSVRLREGWEWRVRKRHSDRTLKVVIFEAFYSSRTHFRKESPAKLCLIAFKDMIKNRSQGGNKHRLWEFHFESSGYLCRDYTQKPMGYLKQSLWLARTQPRHPASLPVLSSELVSAQADLFALRALNGSFIFIWTEWHLLCPTDFWNVFT